MCSLHCSSASMVCSPSRPPALQPAPARSPGRAFAPSSGPAQPQPPSAASARWGLREWGGMCGCRTLRSHGAAVGAGCVAGGTGHSVVSSGPPRAHAPMPRAGVLMAFSRAMLSVTGLAARRRYAMASLICTRQRRCGWLLRPQRSHEAARAHSAAQPACAHGGATHSAATHTHTHLCPLPQRHVAHNAVGHALLNQYAPQQVGLRRSRGRAGHAAEQNRERRRCSW